jgi:hypothetical protein
MAKRIIGIDVGKEKLDAALNGQKRVKSWANDETDRAKLAAWVVDQGYSKVEQGSTKKSLRASSGRAEKKRRASGTVLKAS